MHNEQELLKALFYLSFFYKFEKNQKDYAKIVKKKFGVFSMKFLGF